MIADSEVLQAAAESLPSTPPSERDLEIFTGVYVDCRRQVDVAAQFGISQSRVSQICNRIITWQAGMGMNGELADHEMKKVEGWIDAQRVEWLYEHTLENYRRSCQPKRREQKGTNQHGEWQAETIDHPEGNLQCLRLAARLLELRWKVEEKYPQPSPHALAHCDEDIFINRLISMRHWAEVRGEVPRGEQPGHLVRRLLDELLGRGGSTKAPTSGRGEGPPTSATCAAEQRDGALRLWPNETLADGHVMPAKDSRPPEVGGAGPAGAHHAERDGCGANTANNISAVAPPYEPAADAGADAVNDCPAATCDARAAQAEAGGEACVEAEKSRADMSGAATAGQASSGTSATTGRGYAGGSPPDLAEEERLALAELRRTFSVEMWPSRANHSVPNMLAEGQTNLVLQGYTREQRQALLGWQRVMDLRGQRSGVRSCGPGGRNR